MAVRLFGCSAVGCWLFFGRIRKAGVSPPQQGGDLRAPSLRGAKLGKGASQSDRTERVTHRKERPPNVHRLAGMEGGRSARPESPRGVSAQTDPGALRKAGVGRCGQCLGLCIAPIAPNGLHGFAQCTRPFLIYLRAITEHHWPAIA